MATGRSQAEFFEYFDKRFGHSGSSVLLDIEEETLGTRCGAASWSTPDQVEWLAAASGLAPGDRFLDIGSGTGWPGLAISRITGASPVLTDVPASGLETAAQSLAEVGGDALLAQADATLLPFGSGLFDAVTHSDVLCCLPGKLSALTECRRVLSPDGAMVFTVILVPEEIGVEEARERMVEGNEYVVADQPYPQMLDEAGFVFDWEDLTDAFYELAVRTARARSTRESALVEVLGEDEALQMISRSKFNVAAIEDGLLRRRRYVARPS